MPMPELCLSYAGTARLPQGPRRPSSGQRSAHPLPSWPFTSCILHPLASLNSQLSALGSYSPRADLSRCLFTPLLRRLWLALSVFASLRSLCVSLIFFFFHLRRGVFVSVSPGRDATVYSRKRQGPTGSNLADKRLGYWRRIGRLCLDHYPRRIDLDSK